MKKVKTGIVLSIFAVVLAVCIGASFFVLSSAKSSFAKAEESLPESAISTYLHKIENKDYDGLYEDSLIVTKHLNSKEDYISEMERIYGGVKADDIAYAQIGDTNTYQLASNGKYLATVELLQDSTGKYLASTIFSGDNSYVIEVPTGLSLTINGLTLEKSYQVASNVPASNFSGLEDETLAPKVDRYQVDNLLGKPEIFAEEGYTTLEDVVNGTIYVGKTNTDESLTETFANYAVTCAKFPAKEASVSSVTAISVRNSDWYDRISGMQNDWFTSHNVSSFSNVNAYNIILQSEDSAVGYVTFDYYASNGDVERTWHGGYQMTLLKQAGTWKIAAFGINNDLNPASGE